MFLQVLIGFRYVVFGICLVLASCAYRGREGLPVILYVCFCLGGCCCEVLELYDCNLDLLLLSLIEIVFG